MKEQNFAEGYNVLMGEVLKDHPANKKYSKVHTGDAWLPARNRYCQKENDMQAALIVFVDKSLTNAKNGSIKLKRY